MGLYDNVVEPARRTMVLFFVVDTSGSMSGAKIGQLNDAIEGVLPEIVDISDNNADSRIKIATLRFSTGAHWIDNAPVDAINYRWNYLNAQGVTDLGAACLELNEKLSRKAYMGDVAGSFAPVIFLMSDGEPTDNYMNGLEKLRQNNWFQSAIKVAIAIGNDANLNVLSDFTGTSESVITVHTPEALRYWIQFLAVTSTQIGSKSSNTSSGKVNLTKQEQVIREIQEHEHDTDLPTWNDDDIDEDAIVW